MGNTPLEATAADPPRMGDDLGKRGKRNSASLDPMVFALRHQKRG